MHDEVLKNIYEKIYAEGKDNFFTFSTLDISKEVVSELAWNGLKVLEVGCGTGDTAFLLAEQGARVLATDYSESAVKEAKRKYTHENLEFIVGSLDSIDGLYDCIVIQEVIEHTDDPFKILSLLKKHIKCSGYLIVTCPSFMNIRGIVWMTLQILFDVTMSLTDKHFICPFDMERWALKLNMSLNWRTFRHSQAHGEQMFVDMKKRLTNALRDAQLDNSKVDVLLRWLKDISNYEQDSSYNGAKCLYRFTKLKD